MQNWKIYGKNHPYYTVLTKEVCLKIFGVINSDINIEKFDLNNMEIDYDIEYCQDCENYINKKEITKLEKLYKKDSIEFINKIFWSFLKLNHHTSAKLDIIDYIVEKTIEDSEFLHLEKVDEYIQNNTKYKTFTSFQNDLKKLHGIDFKEYFTYKNKTFKSSKNEQFGTNIKHVHIEYAEPIIHKLAETVYVELSPDMDLESTLRKLTKQFEAKQSTFIKKLPTKNTAQILIDSVILYKYLIQTKGNFEQAIRLFNFHILLEYGISSNSGDEYVSMSKQLQGITKNLMSRIETEERFEITKSKISERKVLIKRIVSLLELPDIRG